MSMMARNCRSYILPLAVAQHRVPWLSRWRSWCLHMPLSHLLMPNRAVPPRGALCWMTSEMRNGSWNSEMSDPMEDLWMPPAKNKYHLVRLLGENLCNVILSRISFPCVWLRASALAAGASILASCVHFLSKRLRFISLELYLEFVAKFVHRPHKILSLAFVFWNPTVKMRCFDDGRALVSFRFRFQIS